MHLSLAMENLGSSKIPKTDSVSRCFPTEETQEAWCIRGLHVWILEDDKGLYCNCCSHVELDPRDILPQWVHKTRRRPGRRYSYTDELPESSKHYVEESLVNKDSAFDGDDDANGTKMYLHQKEGFEFLWRNLAGGTNLAELKNAKPNEVGGCIISFII